MSPESFANSRSDVVLVRCRDTIERLHNEVEAERKRCAELQDQVDSLQSQLRQVTGETTDERARREDLEAQVQVLEQQHQEIERQLREMRASQEGSLEQQQRQKSEVLQKAQELFAKGLRVTELEGAVHRAEAMAKSAQDEADRAAQELRSLGGKLSLADAEVAQLRSRADSESQRADRAARLLEERERRCQAMQHEIEDLQASIEANEELQRQQLQEVQMRQDLMVQAWKEQEAELRHGLSERDEAQTEVRVAEREADAAKQQVRRLTDEKRELQSRLDRLESEASQFKKQVESGNRQMQDMQRQLADSQRQLADVQRQLGDRAEELLRQRHAESLVVQRLDAEVAESRRQLLERSEEVERLTTTLGKTQIQVQSDILQNAEEVRRQVEQSKRVWEEETKLKIAEARGTADEARAEAVKYQAALEEVRVEHRRQADAARLELFDLRAREERHLADYRRVNSEVEELRSRNKVLEERGEELQRTSQKELQKSFEGQSEANSQLAELTWRLEAVNGELERSHAAAYAEKERCRHLEELLRRSEAQLTAALTARPLEVAAANTVSKEVAADMAKVLAQAQRHAEELEKASEAAAAHQERLKLKYEQKLDKMYRHVSSREAYERSLKAFIENEVDVLHKYNQELDIYCHRRQVRPPPAIQDVAASRRAVDKVEKRILRNLMQAGC